jgi:hypothetical protein
MRNVEFRVTERFVILKFVKVIFFLYQDLSF